MIEIFKTEKKIIDTVLPLKNIVFLITVSFLGLYIRFMGFNYISSDLKDFLIPWFDYFKENGGIIALKNGTGDYNLLYQTIIAITAQLNVSRETYIFCIKALSCIFDYLTAFFGAYYITKILKKDAFFYNCIFAVILLLPTVVTNSAYWGQCDSAYTFFLVVFLGEMFFERYKTAFLFYGLAFAFKFQSIFLLPFALVYYLYKRKFSIINFAITLVTFWLSGIVAYINGCNLLAPFKIYFSQTDTYKSMYLNFPSFWVMVGDRYDTLKGFAVLLALSVCGGIIYFVIEKKLMLDNAENYFSVAVWFLWSCLIFLPAMHERYAYPLDILLILLSFINFKYVKFAVVSVISSMLTCFGFLFSNSYTVTVLHSVLFFAVYIYYSYTFLKRGLEK